MKKSFTWNSVSASLRTMLVLLSVVVVIYVIHPISQSIHTRELAESEEEGLQATVVLLFMFFGLAIGILAMQGLSLIGDAIPYTCLVFLLGVVFSLGNNSHDGTFGQSIGQWVDIDADLLLFVFLPPLIFGEAMSLNWYHVRGGFLQSVILAGPGVLIGAALMGAITKVLLPYNWSWTLSMVFGSILSATDPVAVVALLKSVGASPKLTILIVGESLLNDGSAMVLFTLFFNSLNGTKYTVASIISFFLSAAFGSVLLGIAFGLITVRWLRSANRPLKEIDVTTQIAITICCAYLCFFTAQYAFKISGVLACCGAGAMLAWLAPPIILNHESMHNVWSMIEWSLNTLIFLLAGLIIGNRVISKVYAIDWLYLVVLYLLLMAIRAVTIALLYPSIAYIGHRCTLNEAIFMSWAGLRGALGMALALIVEKYCPDHLRDETSRLFFFVGGIAALTLVFNATTAKALLFKLGLLGNNSAEKQLVTDQIKKKLRKKMDKVIEHMTKEFAFTPDDLDVVRQSCTLLQHVDMDALYRDTERASMLLTTNLYSTEENPLAKVMVTESPVPASAPQSVDKSYNNYNNNSSFGAYPTSNNNNSNNNNNNNPLRRGSHQRRGSHKDGRSQSFTRRRNSSVSQLLGVGSGEEDSRQDRISRLLSRGGRGSSSLIDDDLLQYIRAVFLEIVRVKYWHFIEVGKLPRLSHSAQYLLYTVEVGLDEVKHPSGARDWRCLEEDLDYRSYAVFVLTLLENYTPSCVSVSATNMLGRIEARNEKRFVYMLTSFIEAHEHAQKKIHAFLGLDDEEVDAATPEELKVVDESRQAVLQAKKRLNGMNSETINAIRSKQAARLVLAKEAEMVKAMVQEGLLTSHHAEEFLEEISHDTQRIEKERNQMYREHAKQKGERRHLVKQEEFEARASSLFAPFVFRPTWKESLGGAPVVSYKEISGTDLDDPLLVDEESPSAVAPPPPAGVAAAAKAGQQQGSSAAKAVFHNVGDDDDNHDSD